LWVNPFSFSLRLKVLERDDFTKMISKLPGKVIPSHPSKTILAILQKVAEQGREFFSFLEIFLYNMMIFTIL
jgi:hypothetical protein